MEDRMINKTLFRIIAALIIVIWSFATIHYGFYVDENGLLSVYKGIYQGQHMFVDSWEALQTGGILAYPLLALYYQVIQPLFTSLSINVGLVLFMRCCYMFTRLLVAAYVYYTLRNSDFEEGAFYASAFYYMFVIAWKNFSYKSYCDIAMMLIICFTLRFINTRKSRFAVFSAIAVCVSILAYPSMIVMGLFLGAFWLCLAFKDEAPRSAFIGYLIICVIIGALVIGYLQINSGWSNILAQLPNLGDQDYDYPIYIRLAKMLLSYVAFAGIAYLPIAFIALVRKARGIDEMGERFILTTYFIVFMILMFALRIESVSTSRFIYGCLIIFFWFPYFMRNKEDNTYTRIGSYGINTDKKKSLWFIFIFSCVAQLIWSVSTNQEITVPGHMTIYVVMAMILLFAEEEFEYRVLNNVLLAIALFFMGIWVADSNGGFCSAFENMYYVTRGELKGVALPEDEYYLNESVMNLLEDNVTSDDKLLVAFGANCAGYLNSDARQATYSVYARTHLNTKLMDYYKLNPDNMADYMLLDKGHDKYEPFLENETGKYLLELYPNEIAKDGNLVLLSR